MLGGYRVRAVVTLLPANEGGLCAPLEAGNRSLQFVFPYAEGEEPLSVGASVERVEDAGDYLEVELLFWADIAQIVASPASEFDVWYRRTVGHGKVVEVIDGSS